MKLKQWILIVLVWGMSLGICLEFTREISQEWSEDGALAIEVVINVADVTEREREMGWILAEQIPAGWEMVCSYWNDSPKESDIEFDGLVKWLFGFETPLEDGALCYRLEPRLETLEDSVLAFWGEVTGWQCSYGIGGDEKAYVTLYGPGMPGELRLELRHGWNLVGLPIVPDDESLKKMMEYVSVVYEAMPDEYGLLALKNKNLEPEAFAKSVFWCYAVRNSRNLVLYGVVSDLQRKPDETIHGWQVVAAQPLLDDLLQRVAEAKAFEYQNRSLQKCEGELVSGKGYWIVIP